MNMTTAQPTITIPCPVAGTRHCRGNQPVYTPNQLRRIPAASMRYYDLKRHWTKRVQPHLTDPELNAILVRDFNRFIMGPGGKSFTSGQYPEEFESCDWDWDHRGPRPRYWRYVKQGACHWLVNFACRLANLAEPKQTWRIVTSENHSTVWDGHQTLFEFNFQAMGISAPECWKFAIDKCKVLQPGQYCKTYFADHCSHDLRRPT